MDIIQGTPEWFAARCGKVTASRVVDLLAKTKSGYSTSRANYAGQLVAEILTGEPAEDGYINADMQRGTELEPQARAIYELQTDCMVDQVGFMAHSTILQSGASPDGLVGEDGMVEIKCPRTHTHIGYILDKGIPSKYIPQMIWQMACSGRKWVDFVSYDPRMPEELRLVVRRLERDDERVKEIEAEVVKFLAEVNETVDELKKIIKEAKV
jgi:putative phage-type endonuclease